MRKLKMNSYIREAQQLMKDAGYYNSGINGVFDAANVLAIKSMLAELGHKTKYPVNQKPLAWITEATKHIGLKEIKGKQHNKTILQWVKNLNGWFTDDETPWCGTFIAQCLQEADRDVPKHWYRALAYLKYGTKLDKPAYGSIAVMSRSGGGHATFVVGESEDGKYIIGLGGNQSDMVNLAKFPKSRISAYVWPSYKSGAGSSPYPERYNLPKYDNNIRISTKES